MTPSQPVLTVPRVSNNFSHDAQTIFFSPQIHLWWEIRGRGRGTFDVEGLALFSVIIFPNQCSSLICILLRFKVSCLVSWKFYFCVLLIYRFLMPETFIALFASTKHCKTFRKKRMCSAKGHRLSTLVYLGACLGPQTECSVWPKAMAVFAFSASLTLSSLLVLSASQGMTYRNLW